MIRLIQRVGEASVAVEGRCVGRIARGLLVPVGVEKLDDEAAAQRLLERILSYRVFPDAEGKMNLSLTESGDSLKAEEIVGRVINILDPDVVVLGGGMSNIERLYANVPALGQLGVSGQGGHQADEEQIWRFQRCAQGGVAVAPQKDWKCRNAT